MNITGSNESNEYSEKTFRNNNNATAGQHTKNPVFPELLHKAESPRFRVEKLDYVIIIRTVDELSFKRQKCQVVKASSRAVATLQRQKFVDAKFLRRRFSPYEKK